MQLVPEKHKGLEFLDLPPDVCSVDELEESLAEIRLVNRYLGNRRALLKYLGPRLSGQDVLTVLDVGTATADLPVAVVEWARRRGVKVEVTAVDINNRSIEIARRQTANYPEIRLKVADGLSLPYPDASFDYVLCNKTLHHMSDQDSVQMVREIVRVAKRGYIVTDLRRSWIAYALIRILTRIFSKNRITRYDGPLSVLKSFTKPELTAIASRAGARGCTVSREPFWLLVLSGTSK